VLGSSDGAGLPVGLLSLGDRVGRSLGFRLGDPLGTRLVVGVLLFAVSVLLVVHTNVAVTSKWSLITCVLGLDRGTG
jgi:hypothetical protein